MSRYIARPTTILTLLATLFLIPIAASAQSNNTESPYSRFGLGRLDKQTSHALRGMGGLTSAIRDNMIINPANPASYTAVDSMTFLFDFGLSMGMNMLTEAGKRDARMVGNFDYATALIPLGKHFAASAGLVPYSTRTWRPGSLLSLCLQGAGQSTRGLSRLRMEATPLLVARSQRFLPLWQSTA